VEVKAGSGCSDCLQTAIDEYLKEGGTINIVADGGTTVCEFDKTVKVYGNTKVTAAPGVTLEPSTTFAYDSIMFSNKHRGGRELTEALPGMILDPQVPATTGYGNYYDSNIILENLVFKLNRRAKRSCRFVAANNVVYKNITVTESGGAAISDVGCTNRYCIGSTFIDSGRGSTTFTDYMGSVKHDHPPRARGDAYWFYNTFINGGDDAIGNIGEGIPPTQYDPTTCWYDRIAYPEGWHPFCAIVGNTIIGITQSSGIKLSFIPGFGFDALIEDNVIDGGISFNAIQIKNLGDIRHGTCPLPETAPDGKMRVDIVGNTFSDFGSSWNDGIWYWADTGSGYEKYIAETCEDTRASERSDGFYSGIFIRSELSKAGEVLIRKNTFTAGTGYAVYNNDSAVYLEDNTYNNFVEDVTYSESPLDTLKERPWCFKIVYPEP
jgi:hypothetical protein